MREPLALDSLFRRALTSFQLTIIKTEKKNHTDGKTSLEAWPTTW